MKEWIFLIDADDTVLDFHRTSSSALINAFKACGLAWKEEYANAFKNFNDKLWEALERKELTRKELVDTRFPRFLQCLKLPSVGEEFNGHYLKYLATHPEYTEGAEDFLKVVRSLGKIYIVTNGTQWIQNSRFTISGLFNLCEDAFISETAGADKPAKRYTDYVISHIPNLEKERAIWIGDSLSADIKAANDANIKSIWYNPQGKAENGKAKPDYVVRNFEEILEILQKIKK